MNQANFNNVLENIKFSPTQIFIHKVLKKYRLQKGLPDEKSIDYKHLIPDDLSRSNLIQNFQTFCDENKIKVNCGVLFEKSYEEWEKEEKEKENQFDRNIIKNSIIKIDNYIENAEAYYKLSPFFYDEFENWWIWEDNRWKMTDDVDMSRKLDSVLGFEGQTVTSGLRNNHLEAMKWVGRDKKPKEAKLHWIQFKGRAFSIYKKIFYDVTPNYFFTNPIEWDIGESEDTPTLDKLFEEWVGREFVIDLYELIAYSCYRGYPIQTIVCLVGCGCNGKSSFLNIMDKFLGKENICSTDLDLITGSHSSRFETSKLYKKLLCKVGETNFGILNKSSILKKLTGGDMIGFEKKGKQPFDDYNYSKIIIASNSLPSTEDTSEGFYRRWHIINFPNQFPEGKNIIDIIPDIEYNNLAKKVVRILPELLDRGSFTNQGTIVERKNKYQISSNPLPMFLETACIKNSDFFIRYSELYSLYIIYLQKLKKRVVSRKEFSNVLDLEGYEVVKTTKNIEGNFINDRWVLGLKLGICASCDSYAANPTQKKHYIEEVELSAQPSQSSQNTTTHIGKEINLIENTLLPCSKCGLIGRGHTKEHIGKILCDMCFEITKVI